MQKGNKKENNWSFRNLVKHLKNDALVEIPFKNPLMIWAVWAVISTELKPLKNSSNPSKKRSKT